MPSTTIREGRSFWISHLECGIATILWLSDSEGSLSHPPPLSDKWSQLTALGLPSALCKPPSSSRSGCHPPPFMPLVSVIDCEFGSGAVLQQVWGNVIYPCKGYLP